MKNDGQLFEGNETTDLHLLAYELDAIGTTTMTTGYNDDDDNKDNEDEGDRDAEKVEVEDDEGGGDERINRFIDLPSKARPWFSPLVQAL